MKKVLLTVLERTNATLLIAFAIGFWYCGTSGVVALLIAIAALIEGVINAAAELDASASVRLIEAMDGCLT